MVMYIQKARCETCQYEFWQPLGYKLPRCVYGCQGEPQLYGDVIEHKPDLTPKYGEVIT